MAIVYVDKGLCIGCKRCVDVCPVNVFDFESKIPIPRRLCMGCSYCEVECPVSAIKIDRQNFVKDATSKAGQKSPIEEVQLHYSSPSPFQSIYEEGRK